MNKSKFVITLLLASITYSSASAMELQEDNAMKWGRRIGGGLFAILGSTILYFSIKDHLENGTSLYNKTNIGAAALVVGGLGSFTTKEYGIARPVYHPDNGPEEDKEIAKLVTSYKNKDLEASISHLREIQSHRTFINLSPGSIQKGDDTEETEEESSEEPAIDPHYVSVTLPFLHTIIQNKSLAKKANELYYNQQKPILARIPIIGAPIDGILYDPASWERYPLSAMRACRDSSVAQIAIIGLWVCKGAYSGIYKALTQEKTPEDKEFEQWVHDKNSNVESMRELWILWLMNSNSIDRNPEKIRGKSGELLLGDLPIEIIVNIGSFLHVGSFFGNQNINKIDCKSVGKSLHIVIPKNQLIQYVLPYMGPWLKIEKEMSGNEYGVCTQSKIVPTRVHIAYDNCKLLEATLNQHYQATVARRYFVL